jgi:putative aldouronate transport system substrate-binding protein
MKRWITLLITVIVCCLVLASCAPADTGKTVTPSESPSDVSKDDQKTPAQTIVDINWIQVGGGMPANYDAWKKNMDKYLEEKIGVHLDVEVVSWGDWGNRRSLIVNTNEYFDILFNDMTTYASDVALGAYMDITDLVQTAAPKLYSFIPKSYWDACRIGGKIYAVPTYKDSSCTQYFVWDKAVADKYNIDYNNMHQLADLTDALKAVKEGENITPFILTWDGLSAVYSWYDRMGSGLPAIGVRYDDSQRKVVAVFEQEDVMKDLKTLRAWYQSGIINADAATLPENPKYRFCFAAQGWSSAAKTVWGPQMGVEAVAVQWGDTVVSNETVQGSLNSISSSCKNPAKALELLQIVNTDSYVRDSLFYGLEGENFEYTADKKVHRINMDWTMAGYTQGTFFAVTQTDDVDFNQWDEVKELNEQAKPSVLLGFVFDTSPVSDKLMNCIEIYNRYKAELLTGTVEPEKCVADMMTEMRTAGFDDIVAEAQAQIDKLYK